MLCFERYGPEVELFTDSINDIRHSVLEQNESSGFMAVVMIK